ncbi:Splicing factor 3A subunit 1 [Aphelenchoides bicaudatus]|nr:Splicing factor 3A subunit 1 [Aphelenchoides bicaudatus]
MASAKVSNREEDSMNNEPSMTIVEKTAQFVARNGIEFENKIREKEINNARFSFLSPTDPYHAFYRSRVSAFESGAISGTDLARAQLPEAVREHVQQAEFVPTHAPPPFEYTADPATIVAFDLDLMRLTAMFVARNGRQFLTQLMNREVRNFQFDFLKPQHSNFSYFTKLVEQYTKVIIPAKSIVDDLTRTLDYELIMGDVRYRVAWEKHQRNVKDREDKAVEKERMAYNSIDWHDFVVVQTVDFQPSETLNLPPLCTQRDVGTRILMQQRTEAAKIAAETVAMDMESDSDEEDNRASARRHQQDEIIDHQRPTYEVTQPTPAPPKADSALIRDYDPKRARQNAAKKPLPDKYIISPLTNERISATQLGDHMRYNTVAPQYKEQRDRDLIERQEEDALINSSGTEISRNIALLAERRSDIFGVGVQGGEQTAIGQKLGEKEQTGPPRPDPRHIWDGQQSTIDATTRYAQHQALHAQQERFSNPAPPPVVPQSSSYGMPPPIIPSVIASSQDRPISTLDQAQLSSFDAPASKRPRLEDNLEPEELWVRQVVGPISLAISAPALPEWNLNGQTFGITADVTSTVADLKTQIQDQTTMPSSKQKLMFEGMFLKDTNTLAFYNMQNGSTIQLQKKERGGR